MENKKILNKNLIEYLPEVIEALTERLKVDDKKWGDTLKERGLFYGGLCQEHRFKNWIDDKWEIWLNSNEDFPWLKIMGEAMIGYVREKYLRNKEK